MIASWQREIAVWKETPGREYSRSVEEIRRKLKRHKPGSETYHDLLPDLSVQLDVLRLKVKHAAEALEEYEESLSDG